jgi:DNA-binding transcriptional MerR regulator
MPDETDNIAGESEQGELQVRQIQNALKLLEELGERLRALKRSPLHEQTALDKLLSCTEQLLDDVRSLSQSDERESEQPAELKRRVASISIPEKQYYKIGEVSEILDREPYVLRYWESEFKILKPIRNRARQRLYSAKDLEIFKEIARLETEEKLTIAGVKKRLKEMYSESTGRKKQPSSGSRRTPATSITIPDKQYYKIGEVSEILDVEPYVLRYWESEYFPPRRTRARYRTYHKKEIEKLLLIKHLLYDEKYTIAGVRLILEEMKKRGSSEAKAAATTELTIPEFKPADSPPRPDLAEALADIKNILQEIKQSLNND